MGPVVMIVGVLLMVIIHEAGHFVAAKAFNIKATEAFFGFGPRIWSTTRGETEYGVKALPLGGYVRIIGMNPFEEVAPEDEGRTYREKPFWQKSVVVLAGIGSHFVIAFILFYALSVGYGMNAPTTEIESVSPWLLIPDDAPDAIVADLEPNDTIVSVAGIPFAQIDPNQRDPHGEVEVVIERRGTSLTVTTTDTLVPTPAALVGLRPGDELLAVDGVEFTTWEQFVDLTRARPGREATITLNRGGQVMTLVASLTSRSLDGEEVGFLGVAPSLVIDRAGPIEGLGIAASDIGFAVGQSFAGLVGLVTNFDELVGAMFSTESAVLEEVRPISPIGLAQVAGFVGIAEVIALLALVNVFVGVLNVIPLYPLDGGHFAVALYERIRGRHADVRKLVPIAAAVFAFIVVLGVLGFYFDIVDPIELPR